VAGVGAAVEPLTFASTVPVATVAKLIVPVLVIGPPISPVPVATLVTVPAPAPAAQDGSAPVPPLVSTAPEAPAGNAAQTVAPRYSTIPRVAPSAWSSSKVSAVPPGAAVPPLMLASTLLSPTVASDSVPLDVIGPPVRPAPELTVVTVPAPDGVPQVMSAAGPPERKNVPSAPGVIAVQPVPPRRRIEPRSVPTTASSSVESDTPAGAAAPAVTLASRFSVGTVAN